MQTKPVSRCVLLFSALIVLAACSKPEAVQEPVRAVKVLTVGADLAQRNAEFAGEVRARVESRLGFRVAGKVMRRPAELGQRVKAGELLAQLDAQDYQLSVDAARAQLAAAASSRDLAVADFKRYQDLRAQNFISSAELERREASLKAAQAQWDQARSQLAAQGNQARYTSLVSDVAGVVTAVEAEVGQVVAAGTVVVRIAQDGPRDVVFVVPEDKVQALRVGMAAEVKAWAQQTSLKGVVREVAASADAITRTFTVKVELDSKEALPLGSTANVTLQALAKDAAQVIKLPTSALLQDAGKTAVWVLDPTSMTVRLNPIDVAGVDGSEVVVRAGLQPGMQVVTAGVHVLSPAQKVTLYQPRPLQQPAQPAAQQPFANAAEQSSVQTPQPLAASGK